ncbi:MAG: YafY family transcriptional regulator [Alphaproteobacteria bacterium]|nr:YafY family transcriptional regulator [Alphaproteobacteria bacterium]
MRRADRLLELLQALRRLRPPVTAAVLARTLEVSTRTVYRDIEALRRLGVGIDGEAGFGYLLTDDNALPPLKFTGPEVEALALGLRKVMAIGDAELAHAAEEAMTKLVPVLPKPVRSELERGILLAHSYSREGRMAELARRGAPPLAADPALIRKAARAEKKLEIGYRDEQGRETSRIIWPLAIAYLDTVDLVIAWCELREDFRTFRLDRFLRVAIADGSFRPQRVPKLRIFLDRMAEERRERDSGLTACRPAG